MKQIKHNTRDTYGRMDALSSLVLPGVHWSASCHGGCWVNPKIRLREVLRIKSCSHPHSKLQPLAFQPVANRFTDRANLAPEPTLLYNWGLPDCVIPQCNVVLFSTVFPTTSWDQQPRSSKGTGDQGAGVQS